MPEMDGLEAAWKIRQLEAPCERCKAREPAMAEEALNMACQECYRVPIWAVSACSDKDQALSPVVHHLQGSLHEGVHNPSSQHEHQFKKRWSCCCALP